MSEQLRNSPLGMSLNVRVATIRQKRMKATAMGGIINTNANALRLPTVVAVMTTVPLTATVEELILDATSALIRPRASSRAFMELLKPYGGGLQLSVRSPRRSRRPSWPAF